MKDYKYKKFTDEIEKNIVQGLLKQGDRLPSVRKIKDEYKLSISSIQNGYDYLVYKGLVKSIPRFGYIVAYQFKKHSDFSDPDFKSIPWDSVFRENLFATSHQVDHNEISHLNAAVPSDFLIPQNLVLGTMQKIIREKGASLLRYYPSNGKEELRELISKRSALHGASVQQEEIITTDGALQALYIALAVTTQPNDIIAIESPCVFSVLEVIATLRLRTVEIPVRNNTGIDLNIMEDVCKKNDIKAIVVTPNFHNPTGILMSDKAKIDLYHIASSHHIAIIENDIYGDLYFNGIRPSTIRNYDNQGLVITASSFSKSVAPGIRLGWLSAGRFFTGAERLKFALGRSVSPINQEVAIKLLSTLSYERHLRLLRRQLELQATKLLNHFNEYLPGISTTMPQGGYSLWIQLEHNRDMKLFYKTCEKSGVNFTPGHTFSFSNTYDHYFRAVFSSRLTSESFAAIEKIGKLMKK